MAKYIVRQGDSWESIAGRLTGNQRQFLEIAKANPNVYQLAPGMVIDVPDVFPETPNVSITPEMAKAGYATTGEIAAWYKNNPNYAGMPSAFTATAGGAQPVTQPWMQPVYQQKGAPKQPTYGMPGYNWAAPVTKGAPALQPATYGMPGYQWAAKQPTTTQTKPTGVQQTAEGRQRQFYTGQPTLQTTAEARQRAQPAPRPSFLSTVFPNFPTNILGRLPQRVTQGFNLAAPYMYPGGLDYRQLTTPTVPSAAPPVAPKTAVAPGAGTFLPLTPANQMYSAPIGPPTEAEQLGAAGISYLDIQAVADGVATPEQEARVAKYFGTTAAPAVPAPAAPAITPSPYYLYPNPYYTGGEGPEMERNKTRWGSVIYDNITNYTRKIAATPLRDSGLTMGLFNWRSGW